MRVYISYKNETLWMTPVETFQANLIELRKLKGMTQIALSKQIGISKRAMCYYEKGSKSFPSSKILLKISDALECTPDELLSQKGTTAIDGRSLEARLMKKFRSAAELPEGDRKILIQLLDSLLEKNELLSKS
jgi:transcriptional regulator with XRE-family HTH domain